MHERSSAFRRELKQSVRGNRSSVCLNSEQIHLSTAVRSGDRSDRGKEILDQIKSGGWFRGKQVDDLRGIRQHAELPPPESNLKEKNLCPFVSRTVHPTNFTLILEDTTTHCVKFGAI